MACKLCKKFRLKYPLRKFEGKFVHVLSECGMSAPIKCAYENSTLFSADNWACETMLELRNIAEEYGYQKRFDDESIGVVPIPENDFQSGFLVMTWYKDRGKTAQAFVVCDDLKPENLNLETAEFIINYYMEK